MKKKGGVWTSPAERAYRYLLAGRVEVFAVQDQRVQAIVTVHNGKVRIVTRTADGNWSCDCPQTHDKCAHLLAVRRVVPQDLR